VGLFFYAKTGVKMFLSYHFEEQYLPDMELTCHEDIRKTVYERVVPCQMNNGVKY
jgi:hypothetical protein